MAASCSELGTSGRWRGDCRGCAAGGRGTTRRARSPASGAGPPGARPGDVVASGTPARSGAGWQWRSPGRGRGDSRTAPGSRARWPRVAPSSVLQGVGEEIVEDVPQAGGEPLDVLALQRQAQGHLGRAQETLLPAEHLLDQGPDGNGDHLVVGGVIAGRLLVVAQDGRELLRARYFRALERRLSRMCRRRAGNHSTCSLSSVRRRATWGAPRRRCCQRNTCSIRGRMAMAITWSWEG